MRLEKGELILDNVDLDHIQGDIDEGLTVAEAFENQVITMGGFRLKDIYSLRIHQGYIELCSEIVTALWKRGKNL